MVSDPRCQAPQKDNSIQFLVPASLKDKFTIFVHTQWTTFAYLVT